MQMHCVIKIRLCLTTRSRHPGLPTAALPQAKENKDGVQPVPAAEARARLREEPLRHRGGEEAARPGALALRDSGLWPF